MRVGGKQDLNCGITHAENATVSQRNGWQKLSSVPFLRYTMSANDLTSSYYDALKALYYDPRQGLSSSPARIKAKLPQYTINQIDAWIKAQSLQQQFHKRTRPTTYFPLSISPGGTIAAPFRKLQVDLLDLSSMSPRNGYKFVYLCADLMSRYIICFNQKSKNTGDCVGSLRQLGEEVHRLGYKIDILVSDNESAFKSESYRQECKELDITQQLVPVDDVFGLAVSDVDCRTVRTYLSRYMEAYNDSDWSTVLPDIIHNLNNSIHRGLGNLTPQQIVDQSRTLTVKHN